MYGEYKTGIGHMRVDFETNSREDRVQLYYYLKSQDAFAMMRDFEQWIRSKYKHEDLEFIAVDEVRSKFYELTDYYQLELTDPQV